MASKENTVLFVGKSSELCWYVYTCPTFSLIFSFPCALFQVMFVCIRNISLNHKGFIYSCMRQCRINYKSMASGPNHSSLDRQILQNDDKNDKTH